MKVLIVLCAAVFCVTAAVPRGMQQNPVPPNPLSFAGEELAMLENIDSVDPVPPKPLSMQHEDEYNGNAISQGLSVPFGIRSTYWTPRLSIVVENTRSDSIYLHWINYNGQSVRYALIQPGGVFRQYSFGSHPWLITDARQQTITLFIPYAANMKIVVDATASWL